MVSLLPFLDDASTADIFLKATTSIDGFIYGARLKGDYSHAWWLTRLLEELARLRSPTSHPLDESEMGQQYLDTFFNRLKATVLLEENNDGFTEEHIRLAREVVRVWGGLRSESSTSSQDGQRSSSEEKDGQDRSGGEEAH